MTIIEKAKQKKKPDEESSSRDGEKLLSLNELMTSSCIK